MSVFDPWAALGQAGNAGELCSAWLQLLARHLGTRACAGLVLVRGDDQAFVLSVFLQSKQFKGQIGMCITCPPEKCRLYRVSGCIAACHMQPQAIKFRQAEARNTANPHAD